MKIKLSSFEFIYFILTRVLIQFCAAFILERITITFLTGAEDYIPSNNLLVYIIISFSVFFIFFDVLITGATATKHYYHGLKERKISISALVTYKTFISIISNILVIGLVLGYMYYDGNLANDEININEDLKYQYIYLIINWVLLFIASYIGYYIIIAISVFQPKIVKLFLWLMLPVFVITPVVYFPDIAQLIYLIVNPLFTYIMSYTYVINYIELDLTQEIIFYSYQLLIIFIMGLYAISINKRYKAILVDYLH